MVNRRQIELIYLILASLSTSPNVSLSYRLFGTLYFSITLGGWHAKAVLQIKRLARAQARTTGKDEDEAIRHLFQRLAVLLVKGNAALLVNRIPSHPLPSVNGEL